MDTVKIELSHNRFYIFITTMKYKKASLEHDQNRGST